MPPCTDAPVEPEHHPGGRALHRVALMLNRRRTVGRRKPRPPALCPVLSRNKTDPDPQPGDESRRPVLLVNTLPRAFSSITVVLCVCDRPDLRCHETPAAHTHHYVSVCETKGFNVM